VIGVVVARIITRIAGTRIRRIQRVSPHAALLLQRLIFYLLVIVVTLIALPIAGIPITIFAVMGGAIAIGIGLGAQNLCNNLISGLIIMFERPIRIGDIIQVSDQEGRVEAINNRCTRVRRTDGVDLLVPNSTFLEYTVTNWTLSDSNVRGKVTVGVAYGSPVRQVESILHDVTVAHDKVLASPEPIVIFEEFGDNALVFDVYFWTRLQRPMDLRMVQSDLRYAIDERLRQADITIAFPQRDVHLDSLRPVEVKVINGGGNG
jgi:small-conductance mechanosensitive channel